MIDIVEFENNQSYANFDGVKIRNRGKIQIFQIILNLMMIIMIAYSWTHVKEIPNTTLLVSLHHDWLQGANLGIFDISKKDRINRIYSCELVKGGN